MHTDDPNIEKHAQAYSHPKFFVIETLSGKRGHKFDPSGSQHVLAPNVSDTTLGEAVVDALRHSRMLSPEEVPAFFSAAKIEMEYKQWIHMLMTRFNLKTKRNLFQNMKSVGILSKNNKLTFTPSCHESLEVWGRTNAGGLDNLTISAISPMDEIGATLQQAIRNCT